MIKVFLTLMSAFSLTANALESGCYRLVIPSGSHTAGVADLDLKLIETNGRTESFEIMMKREPFFEHKKPVTYGDPIKGIISRGKFIFVVASPSPKGIVRQRFVGVDKSTDGVYKGSVWTTDPRTGKEIRGTFLLSAGTR
jgi:hypothetical protein